MRRQIVFILSALTFAATILASSLLKASSPNYNFPQTPNPYVLAAEHRQTPEIDYILPSAGAILPDNPLWFFKALKDKLTLLLTQDPAKKAEIKLARADERLVASEVLFQNGKADVALSTLTKAEKYLEEASVGDSTTAFLTKLTNASLKHREITEEMLKVSSEEIRPKISQVRDYSKDVYKKAKSTLASEGIETPQSPFSD